MTTAIEADERGVASRSPSDRRTHSPGRRTALGTALGVAALALTPRAARAAERGIVGQPAPELDVPRWSGADGEPTRFTIAATRGRWTFLKCFQYWCPGCHSSGFPTLVDVQKAFGADGEVAIAAVQTVFEGHGTNREDRIPEIRERYALEIPIGHDAGDPDADGEERWPTTMVRYRTGGTPWLVLIEPGGTVVFDGFHVDSAKLIDYVARQIG